MCKLHHHTVNSNGIKWYWFVGTLLVLSAIIQKCVLKYQELEVPS